MSKQIEQAYIESAIPNLEVSSKILRMIDAFDAGASGSTVSSVNSKQGAVVLNADDLADGITNQYYTEAKVNNNVNPKVLALQLQINTKANNVLPSVSQYVYVNYLAGNDTSGNGSETTPFKTISKAMDSISDSSENKPYVVGLVGSKQIETSNIFIKPYVSLVGVGQKSTYISAVGFNIKAHSSLATQKSWNLLKNFYLGASTGIDFDLASLTGSNECNLIVENVSISGSFSFKGRSTANDFLEIYNCNLSSTLAIDSTFSDIRNNKILGQVSLSNLLIIPSLKCNFDNTIFKQNLSIDSLNVELNNCSYPITSSLTSLGSVIIDSYRGVPPAARQTLSIGTTLNEYSDSSSSSPTDNYIRAFNNTTDWTLNVDIYEISVLAASHLKGINPQVQTFELISGEFEEVTCNTNIDSLGNLKIKITQSPDLRFNGKIIIS